MRILKRKPWIACIILLWTTTGTFTAAGPALQSPSQEGGQALKEEERLKALQKLLSDMQKNPAGPGPAGAGAAGAGCTRRRSQHRPAGAFGERHGLAQLFERRPRGIHQHHV